MSDLYLSRVSLRRDASTRALTGIILKGSGGEQCNASHSLLWSLFADSPDRERDFLWRQMEGGSCLILSERLPEDRHALFDVESKGFEPNLQSGDKLQFQLCVNATVARKNDEQKGKRERGKRHDIVMDALYKIQRDQRAEKRVELTHNAALSWMSAQGDKAGFRMTEAFDVKSCDILKIPRKQFYKYATFGVMDVTGVLEVTDPERFLGKVKEGFGRAKAFGCGLMLIRRAC
ncbi:type I-E CRISPR-associated protein Cas6/Cse3/CasE [Acetobacteraceae bacterium ESL0709]|nr:type I-E CRISPR-associated protein Cas6/Cse3/CasE [Acetobacteraceae bacterium ESL0697]MDF7677515.1 type I-E CRISPR-associated protein Cas6/Cse3/CasE [Acetobacteraceae bacterium ESL0709]